MDSLEMTSLTIALMEPCASPLLPALTSSFSHYLTAQTLQRPAWYPSARETQVFILHHHSTKTSGRLSRTSQSLIADVSHGTLQKKKREVTLAWASTVWVVSGNMYEVVVPQCIFKIDYNLIILLLLVLSSSVNAGPLQVLTSVQLLIETTCF